MNKNETVKSETKPEHNKYDNIWELRHKRWWWDEMQSVGQILEQMPQLLIAQTILGTGLLYRHVQNFLYAVAKANEILELEAWKILCPFLGETNKGTLYYIIREKQRNRNKQKNLVFKATYGYLGQGPREAALIETCFEMLRLNIRLGDGNDLLDLGFL